MLSPTSRYAAVGRATVVISAPNGTPIERAYLRRRFVPPVASHAVLVEHVCQPGERLDIVAARLLGDPTQFWRLCDASGALWPEELEVVGRVIVVGLAAGR
jgi:hypothetical protein